jgi:hypothetical protein
MSRWTDLFNPAASMADPDRARTAAGASTVALVISGAMSAAGATLMSQQVGALRVAAGEEVRRFAEQSPQTAAILQGMIENGMIEMGVVLVAGWAAVQILLAAWHWRRPGTVIPIIFLVLLTYRLGDRLIDLVLRPGEASVWTGVVVALLALCLILHVTALRGATRLAAIRRAA